MPHSVVITGASSLSSLGMSNAELISNLYAKKINRVGDGAVIDGVTVNNVGLYDRKYTQMTLFDENKIENPISRVIVRLILEALADAKIDPLSIKEKVDVFVGSTFGNKTDNLRMSMKLDEILQRESINKPASDMSDQFLQVSDDLKELFDLTFREDRLTEDLNTCLPFEIEKHSIQAQCVSGVLGSILARDLIKSGTKKMVLVIAYDFFEAMAYKYMVENHLLTESLSLPFDRNNKGMNISDGAAAIILEQHDNAVMRGMTYFYGEIKGAGIVTIPDSKAGPTTKAIVNAIDKAVLDANLAPAEIDMISPHGNGSPEMDLKELMAYQKYFNSFLKDIPIVSYTANIGYSLAGSGIIDIIIMSYCLAHDRVIGTISPKCSYPNMDICFASQTHMQKKLVHYLKVKTNITGSVAAMIISKIL